VPDIAQVVYNALSQQLALSPHELSERAEEDLGALGLDSHGLMRVLLEIEQALGLSRSLELDDAALATPLSMLAGVRMAVGST
jgi:acyl carrier protein